MNNEDWDTIEEDCRCKYQGITKGDCKNSYTNKCDECRDNQLLIGKTESNHVNQLKLITSYYEIEDDSNKDIR
jgi:hypothetical protein